MNTKNICATCRFWRAHFHGAPESYGGVCHYGAGRSVVSYDFCRHHTPVGALTTQERIAAALERIADAKNTPET